ncbi:MAG: serine/threonine-protein phosphatase [Intrasporangium sp.]|uniref:PP2C family protein-serine/threonine phosphatase n=1 Tax=Intrasporangium sp. TaxID=1925024 RepID=UPI002649DEE0|nr:PP2C family protein-serine/threonine phosphatase [Intrasporangium sp.]MDN5795302.1 serine/threonine-protein phosphatase [Intrasporangium sp.]
MGKIASRLERSRIVLVVMFVCLVLLAGLAVLAWPAYMPWSVFALIVVGAGLFLEPVPLLIVCGVVAADIIVVGLMLADRKAATEGTVAVVVVLMFLMLWLSRARSQVGLVGVKGESMLVDMRDRLRAQGELPALPRTWGAEVALESAYGDRFAGDFVVATRSTDGRMLEIALVDVSGKGRNAGTRSLLLSGALGGLLGEMSECGFLRSANNHLLRLRWPEGFATAVHVAIDLETGTFTIGYAGHPAAAQFSAGSGRWTLLSGGRGPLLGVIEDADYPREDGRLRGGDALVLYSDGVIEARDIALDDGIDRMLGRAEFFVTKGFAGLAQRLCDHAAAGHGDDRAVVTVWRR